LTAFFAPSKRSYTRKTLNPIRETDITENRFTGTEEARKEARKKRRGGRRRRRRRRRGNFYDDFYDFYDDENAKFLSLLFF